MFGIIQSRLVEALEMNMILQGLDFRKYSYFLDGKEKDESKEEI